ncbi:MAG TPA: hypothetical protein VF548_17615 [Allosphingosinicella sp.]|jgi:hypothetical protein
MMKIESLGKTVRLLAVSATLGLAGLSATAHSNIKPTNQCELDARAWCTAYTYTEGAGRDEAIEACVRWEMYQRCPNEV